MSSTSNIIPGRQQIPSFQLASGTTNERDNSYNISNTLGSIFYNTDTSNVEIRHEDPSNNVGWRDLVMNNRVGMDLSGVTTATAPTSGTHLCNKTYVDAVTTGAFAQTTRANPTLSYVVGGGNPTDASGGDNLNGRMDTPDAGLEVEITPPSNADIKIDFSIFGEWNADGWDKGVIIARAAQAANGSFTYTSLIRADTDASAPLAARVISTFTNNYTRDASTTPEQAIGFVIDDAVVAGTTYRYIPVLVNAAVSGSNHTFKLNRPITSLNIEFAERGCSAIAATILNVGS
jgi:hypothetical protein